MFNSAVVLGSEASLALYPILIKTVDVGLSTQLFSRFLVFTVLGVLFAGSGVLQSLYGKGAIGRTLGLGGITLAHVFTSYFAFSALPAGVAMALFYTYPVWNLLGGYLGYGETVRAGQLVWVAAALLGVVLLSLGTREEFEGGGADSEGKGKGIHWAGVLAGLGAAFTETLMYFAVRTAKVENPFVSTVELYSGALLGMGALIAAGASGALGGAAQRGLKLEGGGGNWLKMLLFNSIIGFAGYALRFYAIPKMSTLAFSMLSLVGVVASFVWGLLFVSEVPNTMSILGSLMIVMSTVFTDVKG